MENFFKIFGHSLNTGVTPKLLKIFRKILKNFWTHFEKLGHKTQIFENFFRKFCVHFENWAHKPKNFEFFYRFFGA
jgi:hypothetical protein